MTMRQRLARAVPMVCAAALLALGSGCLFAGGRSVEETGERVLEAELQPTEGATTKQEVLDAFGPPRQTLKREDGSEVLMYVYTRKVESGFAIPFILYWGEKTSRARRFNFEFRDGVLVRCWTDDLP